MIDDSMWTQSGAGCDSDSRATPTPTPWQYGDGLGIRAKTADRPEDALVQISGPVTGTKRDWSSAMAPAVRSELRP
jgi:hypothetical protein